MVKIRFSDGRFIEFPLADQAVRDGDVWKLIHIVVEAPPEVVAEYPTLEVMNIEELPNE